MKGRFCITPIKTFSVFLNYFQDYLKFGHKSAFHYLELKWRSAKKYKRGKVISNRIVSNENNYLLLASWSCTESRRISDKCLEVDNLISGDTVPSPHQTSPTKINALNKNSSCKLLLARYNI